MNSRQLIEWRKIVAWIRDHNRTAVQRLHCRAEQRPKDDPQSEQSQPEET